jgi:O-antigen ligase
MNDAPPSAPLNRWERGFLLLAVLLQQAAFIPLPEELLGTEQAVDTLGNPLDPARSNPSNVVLTVACLAILGILSLVRLRSLLTAIKQNPLVVATVVLVLASVAWSYDPGLSLRRAGTYSIGALLALYLVARLDFEAIVRLLALSTVVPAVASFVYALGWPDFAIMQSPEVAGSLRGVYAHKNQIANVMALGFMLQLYLALTTRRRLWHLGLAALHAGLVVAAHSASFTVSLALIVMLLGFHMLVRFNRQLAALAGLAGVMVVLGLGVGALEDPDAFFALLGRDATLTGRTELWPELPAIIAEHLWLGWGYAAFWQADNPVVVALWDAVRWQPPHAHNGFFEIAIDFGLVGLALALVMLARFGLGAWRIAARQAGYEGWIYICVVAYTLFNNLVEISLLRGQEFGWFSFMVFYMTCQARQRAARPVIAAVAPSIVARAKPLAARPAPGGGGAARAARP